MITKNKECYESGAVSSYGRQIAKIKDQLEETLLIENSERIIEPHSGNVRVVRSELSHIINFGHPIMHNGYAWADCRTFTKRNGDIKNNFDYQFAIRRAKLEVAWSKTPEKFVGISKLSADVFATWVSNNIGRNLDLTVDIIGQVKLVCAIYWLGFFLEEELDNERALFYILKQLPRILRVPSMLIERLFSEHKDKLVGLLNHTNPDDHDTDYDPLGATIETINSIIDGSGEITRPVLYNTVCRGAFSTSNGIEICATALEHPPTFALMVFYSVNNHFQRKLSIGSVTGTLIKNHDDRTYTRTIHRLLTGDE